MFSDNCFCENYNYVNYSVLLLIFLCCNIYTLNVEATEYLSKMIGHSMKHAH